MKFQIGAMSVGDILDRGLKLLLARLPTFFVIMFIVQLPVLLVQIIAPVLSERNPYAAFLLGSLVALVLSLALTQIGTAAILHVISQEFIDRRVGIGDAFRVGLARFGSLLLGTLAYGLAVGVGLALCIVPGLIFLSWFSLFSQVIVVEGRGAGDALSRSKDLSEGYRWRILGVLLLLGIVQNILIWGAILVLGRLFPAVEPVQTAIGIQLKFNVANQVIQQILLFPIGALVATYISVCMTLLYFDLRIRKEGFDLELAAQKQAAPEGL